MLLYMSDMRVGESLRSLRATAGLSQAELAHAVGIAARHLDAIERGEVTPSATFVADLVAVIGSRLRDSADGV